MKKALISIAAIVVIFLLVVVIGAKLTSSSVEKKIADGIFTANQSIAELSKKLGAAQPPVLVQLSKFNQHWFSSAGTVTVKAANGITKDIDFTVEHGPFPLSRLTKLKLKPVLFTATAKPIRVPLIVASPALNFTTTVDYSNNYFNSTKLEPISVDMPGILSLEISEMEFDQSCYAKNSKCLNNFALDSFDFDVQNPTAENPKINIGYSLKGLRFDLKTQKTAGFDYLPTFESNGSVQSYTSKVQNKETVHYKNTQENTSFAIADNLATLTANGQVKSLAIFGLDLGQESENIRLANLDAKILNDIIASAFDLQFEKIPALFEQLLAKKPTLNTKLLIGKNKSTASFNLAGEIVFAAAKENYVTNGKLNLSSSQKQIKTLVNNAFDIFLPLALQGVQPHTDPTKTKADMLSNFDNVVKFLSDKGVLRQQGDELSFAGSINGQAVQINELQFASFKELADFIQQLQQDAPQLKELKLFIDGNANTIDDSADDDADGDEEDVVAAAD